MRLGADSDDDAIETPRRAEFNGIFKYELVEHLVNFEIEIAVYDIFEKHGMLERVFSEEDKNRYSRTLFYHLYQSSQTVKTGLDTVYVEKLENGSWSFKRIANDYFFRFVIATSFYKWFHVEKILYEEFGKEKEDEMCWKDLKNVLEQAIDICDKVCSLPPVDLLPETKNKYDLALNTLREGLSAGKWNYPKCFLPSSAELEQFSDHAAEFELERLVKSYMIPELQRRRNTERHVQGIPGAL